MPVSGGLPADAPVSIDSRTAIGAVALTVSDLARARAFYEMVLGLQSRPRDDGELALGAPGGRDLVLLRADPSAPRLDRRAAGLFHLALLVPTRPDLAAALRRIASARWPLSGASDHLVSEALYLNDPDGNGIEIYRDRPVTQWRHDADGAVTMAGLALDLDDLARAGDGGEPGPLAAGTRIGHVHLQVSDLAAAEAFYVGALGFDVTVRSYPGALFVSAGGYHHHLGLNTWRTAGGRQSAPGAVGLRWFELVAPDPIAAQDVLARVAAAEITVERADRSDARLLRDPSGITVRLRNS